MSQMKCSAALDLASGLALGELDVEEKRALDQHLAACAPCRSEAARRAAAVKLLADAPAPESSAARRDRAAAAMKAERGAMVDRLLAAPRRRWLGWAAGAAALLLVGLGGAWIGLSLRDSGAVLRVERLAGSARVIRAGSRESRALAPGDAIRRGDLVSADGVLWLEGPGKSRIALNRESTVKLEADEGPVLLLVQGSLYGEVRSVPHTVIDATNRRLVARDCSFEATLARVAGYVKGPGREATVAEHCAALAERIQSPVVASDEVKDRRVAFGEGGIEAFRQAMAEQGIEVAKRADGAWVAAAGRPQGGSSLLVRVAGGEARIEGGRGSLVLSAGQAGQVNAVGDVEKTDATGPVAPWRK